MLGLHWGGSHVKRSEGKRALPSLSQTSNFPKIANFKKNTPEIVFVCWHQNPLPSLSQTSNLTKLQIPRQIQAHTIVHWTMSILGQPPFSTIIVLVLFCTNCCTGSLTGGLQWPWVWKWTSLQISTFYWIRQLLFIGRNQWSTKSPIHQYKINIQLTSVIYWLELFPPGSSNLGLSPFRWENWHTEIPWKKNIFLTFFRQ